MAVGKNLLSKQVNNCIAVIGDGAITGGMAYEAMNNAAYINTRIVVILNDNGQVPLVQVSMLMFSLTLRVYVWVGVTAHRSAVCGRRGAGGCSLWIHLSSVDLVGVQVFQRHRQGDQQAYA